MYSCPRWGASNYSSGRLLEITAFRSFSSLHLIATMFVSERFKLVLWGFFANRSARNLCSKLCALPWRINKKHNEKNATKSEHIVPDVIPYQGIIEPISTVVLTVLPKCKTLILTK